MTSERVVSDRFMIALIMAGIFHAVVILGVTFQKPEPERIKKSLSVTLIHNPSRASPERADFLAQANQMGSGEGQKKTIPRSEPVPQRGLAETQPEPVPIPNTTPAARPRPVLRQQASSQKKVAADEGTEVHEEPQPHKLDVAALSQQIAELSTELTRSRDRQAHGPRAVYINSVNAHKYKAAAYEQAWQDKIERIGNLNYPDEARRQGLSGSLLLSVGVRPNGTVHSIKILHSSGYAVLDDAAVRIVQLAAPFAPFPAELQEEADILVITRTWRFYHDYRLETR